MGLRQSWLRSIAALRNVELITALLERNRLLALGALQLRVTNGVVSLLTAKGKIDAWRNTCASRLVRVGIRSSRRRRSKCLPPSPSSIAADKRDHVVKLRDMRLVEEFAGDDGRLRFATTQVFLQRFGLGNLADLSLRAEPR